MSTNDYIHSALGDVDTTARRIPHYKAGDQPTMAAYATHVVHARFAEIVLLTTLRGVDPDLADRVAAWIGEVQGDRERLGEILSCWDREAREDRQFTVFGPETA